MELSARILLFSGLMKHPDPSSEPESDPFLGASPAGGFASTMILRGDAPREDVVQAVAEMRERDAVSERCSKCDALLDVSECRPLTEIICPCCGGLIKVLVGFHHFVLLSVLGQGGAGTVYRAFDQTLERDVALKLLRNEHTRDPEYLEGLEREALITASMNHPHVVKVYSTGRKNGFYYIAMEIVSGGSLAQRIKRHGRLPEASVLAVGIQLAEGLQAAWLRKLLHRDVKPGNILFTAQDTVKVADFGLAIPLGQADNASGDIWGTPDYIAPEKLLRQGEDVRSDIYSIGCTLFHCLAGAPPLNTEIVMEVIQKQKATAIPNIQNVAPEVSGGMAFVIKRCLEVDPADRYQGYDELIEHLSYVQGQAASKPMSGALKKAIHSQPNVVARDGMARRGRLAAVVILGLLLVIAGVWFVRESAQAKAQTVADRDFSFAAGLLAERKYSGAAVAFEKIAANRTGPQSTEWALLGAGLAHFFGGNLDQGRSSFKNLQTELEQTPSPDRGLHVFLANVAKLAQTDQSVPAGDGNLFEQNGYQAIGLLILGLKDWDLSQIEDSAVLLRQFQAARLPEGNFSWITQLKPSAEVYLETSVDLRGLESRARTASTPEEKFALLAELRNVRGLGADRAKRILAEFTTRDPSALTAWKSRLEAAFPSAHYKELHDGTIELEMTGQKISNLGALAGMNISYLDVHKNPIADLSPLRGMPLVELDISETDAADLRPLAGAPLMRLNLNATQVADLTPIHALPLQELYMWKTRVTTLEPLRGMQLTILRLPFTQVQDLQPLRKMPLKVIALHSCAAITDLAPLTDCRELNWIVLPPSANNVPVLRNLPNLKRISNDVGSGDRGWHEMNTPPDKAAADFWAEWDQKHK